jgi:hypothetical protein
VFDSSTLTGTYITLASTLTITEFFRCTTSKVTLPAATVGINYVAGVTIPSNGLILRDIQFNGAGTSFVQGITSTDNDALFSSLSSQVTNTYELGAMYLNNNPTTTTIPVAGTFVKGAGTYTADVSIRRFALTTNALIYNGPVSKVFMITGTFTTTITTANTTAAYRFYRNGVALANTEQQTRQPTANQPFHISMCTIATLAPNDNIEVWVTNITNTSTVRIIRAQVLITPIYPL